MRRANSKRMQVRAGTIAAALCVVAAQGCIHFWKPVPLGQLPRLVAEDQPRVRLKLRNGADLESQATAVQDDQLVVAHPRLGETWLRVDLADIRKADVERVHPGWTGLAWLGGTAAVVAVLFIQAISQIH